MRKIKMNKKAMTRRTVYLADAFIIISTLLMGLWMIGYVQPLVIAPINEYSTSNTSILFSFSKADVIFIDDNLEFTSPMKIYAKDNLVINLQPGKYYWKVEGALPSEVRMLQIESAIDLKLRPINDKYEVINAGNAELDVKIYNNGSEIGRAVLGVDSSVNYSGDKFVGGQNG